MKRNLLLLLFMASTLAAAGQTRILMPEINFITHLKSMDEDVRLDSMMRAHSFTPMKQENQQPKEVSYQRGDTYFNAGYSAETKHLMLTFITINHKFYEDVRSQLVTNFKRIKTGKFGDFTTETYSMGTGLGFVEVGFASDNEFMILREIMIPNYYWNVVKYQ